MKQFASGHAMQSAWVVDDLDAAMEVAGGADNFAEPYEYSGRTTAALKGKRFGMSASVLLQGPLLEASKL